MFLVESFARLLLTHSFFSWLKRWSLVSSPTTLRDSWTRRPSSESFFQKRRTHPSNALSSAVSSLDSLNFSSMDIPCFRCVPDLNFPAYRSRLSVKFSSKLRGRLPTSPQELQNILKWLLTLRLCQSSSTFSHPPFSMFVNRPFGLWAISLVTVLFAEITFCNKEP